MELNHSPPQLLPNANFAGSPSLARVSGSDLMDLVSGCRVPERCRVRGGRFHTSRTYAQPRIGSKRAKGPLGHQMHPSRQTWASAIERLRGTRRTPYRVQRRLHTLREASPAPAESLRRHTATRSSHVRSRASSHSTFPTDRYTKGIIHWQLNTRDAIRPLTGASSFPLSWASPHVPSFLGGCRPSVSTTTES